MSALATALDDYLALRRGLGTELRGPAGRLRRFVEFADREGATVVTTELALRWARAPLAATPATHADRLGHVRRFARWLSAIEPRTEVPPVGSLPARYRRRPPYIYSDSEIARLVAAAATLPSPTGLRGPTFATLFGLLAATGLRVSEALALDLDDVDIARGLLTVRHGKFGKARFVPPNHGARPAMLRTPAGRPGAAPAKRGLLHLRARDPDHRVECPLHLCPRLARSGPAGADAGPPPRPRATPS
jgi:integrase/recombinase XerD